MLCVQCRDMYMSLFSRCSRQISNDMFFSKYNVIIAGIIVSNNNCYLNCCNNLDI